VYCPECGHQNPVGNRFCGMCGEHLPERTTKAEKRPTSERRESIAAPPAVARDGTVRDEDAAAERRERIAEHDPEPVAASLRHREPVDETVRESELPAAVADYYSSPRPSEEPTTVSGPSFLGLSGGAGSSSYSYLYEDEQPRSHTGSLAFLLLLAIIGAGVYWKWQPIKDYVVNAALTHSQTGRAAPAAAPTQPGSTTASSDNTANQSGQAANPNNGLPQQDNAATPTDQQKPKADTPKTDQAIPPAANDSDKTSAPKDERPQSEVGRSSRFQNVKSNNASEEDAAADNEKPSARRPAQAAGTELVDTGERYLYGRGVPRNCNQALVNFQAAAKQENPRAMSHLGSLYATGQCVPLDRAQAYQWYSRALAADRSNTYLEHNLNMLWRDMSSTERAKATQKRMF
jgi:hypothetical protein